VNVLARENANIREVIAMNPVASDVVYLKDQIKALESRLSRCDLV
jgi:hypothetical protein